MDSRKYTDQCLQPNTGHVIKPFLRWAGGKSLFIGSVLKHFPSENIIGTYYEPFLGAGSAFLAYKPKQAVLSDLNQALIRTFEAIKLKPALVFHHLESFSEKDCGAYFYKIREEYNLASHSYKQAARFIYLNKACFNGIFRVNTSGKFNVPYGNKKTLAIPSLNHLKDISSRLQHATLLAEDYRLVTETARKGDLVYLDPPYPPLNGSSYFTHYTKERFSLDAQSDVARLASLLSKKGCFVIITNADTPSVRKLYRGWRKISIERTRWITSSKTKHKVKELIITNYNPTEVTDGTY